MQYDNEVPAGRKREPGAANDDTGSQQTVQGTRTTDITDCTAWAVASRSVSWWEVHEFVTPRLARVGSWPMVGTPTSCSLPDDDPEKVAALYSIAEQCALHIETAQQAEAAASQAISAAEDWSAIARQVRERHEWLAANPWARRVIP